LLVERIITGLVLGAAVIATLLFLPTPYAAALLAVLWAAGGWEWARLASIGGASQWLYAAVLLAVMLATAGTVVAPRGADVAIVTAGALWLVALGGILTFPRRIPPLPIAVAGPLALLPSWLLLKYMHAVPVIGPKLALLALALVWAADVGAYATGRAFGRVKLAPKVSPGKTWEGVSGGVVLAALVALGGSTWLGVAAWPLVAIAVCTALVSVVGDLTVSMLKRNIGLKDSGRLLPGHGGVMDRIDGLVAAVPAYAAGLRLAGLLG
jgi:phosphatidate cytidylyltransferase